MFWNGLQQHKKFETKVMPGCLDSCKKEETALYNQILEQGACLRIKVTGRSMEPFLSSNDVVTIKRVPAESLIPGDLIFFTGSDGNQVLHRLVKAEITGGGIMMLHTRGDALTVFDEPFKVNRLLGKACRIEKKSSAKIIDLETKRKKAIGYSIVFFVCLKCRIKSAILFLFGIRNKKISKMA